MPFRGHEGEDPEHLRDAVARFVAIDDALERTRRHFSDRMPQRYAAINAVLLPGEPEQIAAKMRVYAERLRELAGLRMAFIIPMDVLFASVLMRYDDEPDALIDEVRRVRPMMQARRLRWSPIYEFMAVVALRSISKGAPIEDPILARMREVFVAMRSHHWFLTGTDDFPMCALMATRAGEPKDIARRANQIYEALRRDAGTYRGEVLQVASNTLAVSGLEPDELSGRFAALMRGFNAKGLRMNSESYDELAALCYVARPVDAVVACVCGFEAHISANVKWYERFASFNWAANLAFMRFVGSDPSLGPLADIKALLDMQRVIMQRG